MKHAIHILKDELEKAKDTADERECKLPDGFTAEIEAAIEILKKHQKNDKETETKRR